MDGTIAVKFVMMLLFCGAFRYGYVSGSVSIEMPSKEYNIVEELGNLKLTCYATCTNGTCMYSWTSNDVILTGLRTGSSIRLTGIKRGNGSKTVECIVRDIGDMTEGRCTRTLRVLYAPDVSVTVDQTKSLVTCNAMGFPENYTYVFWEHFLNNVHLRTLPGGQNLTLERSYQNTGTYICFVTNGIQSYKTSLNIQKGSNKFTAEDVPIILTPTVETQYISKGDNFSSVIKVYSLPTIQHFSVVKTDVFPAENTTMPSYVQFTRNTPTPISVTFYTYNVSVSGEIYEWSIHDVKEEHFGEYTWSFRNDVGQTNVQVHILPRGPPDVPSEFKVTQFTHNYAVFRLRSGFYNGGNQTFVIQYKTNIGNEWMNGSMVDMGSEQNQSVELQVNGLSPETHYTFQAFSFNIFNQSVERKMIYITTAAEPTNWPVIGSAIGGSVVVVIIVLVLLVLIIKKKRGRKNIPRMLPKVDVTDILAANPDHADCYSPDVYENTDVGINNYSKQEYDIYENTQKDTRPSPESNYANVPAYEKRKTFQTGTSRPSEDKVIYLNTNGLSGVSEAQALMSTKSQRNPDMKGNVNPSVEAVEDDYLDMGDDVSAQKTMHTNMSTFGSTKGSTFSTSQDQDYLDMDVNVNAKNGVSKYGSHKGSTSPDSQDEFYLNIDLRASAKSAGPKKTSKKASKKSSPFSNPQDDYYLDMGAHASAQTNVSKKPSKKGSKKSSTYENSQLGSSRIPGSFRHMKKQQSVEDEPSDVYMDMDNNERDSVPDYLAPPPPGAHQTRTGEGYVNLRGK